MEISPKNVLFPARDRSAFTEESKCNTIYTDSCNNDFYCWTINCLVFSFTNPHPTLNYRTVEIQYNIPAREQKDKGKQKIAFNILSILPSPENNSVLTSLLWTESWSAAIASLWGRDKAIMIKDPLGFFPGYVAHPCGRLHFKPKPESGNHTATIQSPATESNTPGILSLQAACTAEEQGDKVSLSLLLWIRGLESQETFWRYSAAIMFLLA